MIEDYYDQSVLLQSPIYTPDSYGQNIASWTTGVTVNCAIQARSGNYPVIDGVQQVLKSFRMYCSSTVSIKEQDRISQNGLYYYVTFINTNLKSSHHLQIDLEKGLADRN